MALARRRESLEQQHIAVLALPAIKKQRLDESMQPAQVGKRSFWVSRSANEKALLAAQGQKGGRARVEGQQSPGNPPSLTRSVSDSQDNLDSIVASAECLLSLSQTRKSSDATWGASTGAALPGTLQASTEITTNLPLSQESVHFMGCNREPIPAPLPEDLPQTAKQAKGTKRRFVEVAKAPALKRHAPAESFLSCPAEDSEAFSIGSVQFSNARPAWSAEPVRNQTLKCASRSMSASGGSRLVARGIVGKQDVAKHVSGALLLSKPAAGAHPSNYAMLKKSLVTGLSRKVGAPDAILPVGPVRMARTVESQRRKLLSIGPSYPGKKGAALSEGGAMPAPPLLVDTQESQMKPRSRDFEIPRNAVIVDLDDDEDVMMLEARPSVKNVEEIAGPLVEQSAEDVEMERLYDFFGRPFRVYVPARLWGTGVEATPDIGEQRAKESRLVLSELGTMIGLKNARQYSTEFALSKMADEKVINLTSFELADKFLAKVTKNEATREQLRAHLRDVTLPRLRDGTLDAMPKEEELDPTPILELANMVTGMHATIKSAFGELPTPVDFEKQIMRETRALEQATLEIVVVGKPGSQKSLTCNRLVVPGSDGFDGPFHPVPDSRDHGTVVPVFVWKTNRPGLTAHVIGRRKSQYAKLVERRFLAGGITDDELKYEYKCERVEQGNTWQMVCRCPGERLSVPPLEEAIPGVEIAGSSPKDRARFYTSRIRDGYTAAQQLMIEKVKLESNAWEGLEESWELGDMVGFKEQENDLSDVRGVTDDIVREGVKGVPILVHCCGDRERTEEDGILLLKLGIYDGTPDTFPVIVCPEKPSVEQTLEKIWQDNVIALAGAIKKPERLAARSVPNVQHLIQEQEAIVCHLHDALIVMQPVKPLNCPEWKDRVLSTFMRYRTGSLFKSVSIWLNVATGQLKRQPRLSPAVPSATAAADEQKLKKILQLDRRGFATHFTTTLAELEQRVEDDLEDAAGKVADEALEMIPAESLESRDARLQKFAANTAGSAQFGSDIAVCLNKFFLELVDRGCEERIEKQSTVLENVYKLVSGRTQVQETDDLEGPLVYFNRAARVYIQSKCQHIKEGSLAMESAARWGSDGATGSSSPNRADDIPTLVTRTCLEAMQAALEHRDADQIQQSFVSAILDRIAGRARRTRLERQQPVVRRLLTWAEKHYCEVLNGASVDSLQPLIQQLPDPRSKAKLGTIRAEVTRMAEEAQRHNIRMACNMTHSVAYEEQQLPKPLVKARLAKRPDFELLPEVNLDGVDVDESSPGHEISFVDLCPEPRERQTDSSDSTPSAPAETSDQRPGDCAPTTSGREFGPYRVTAKMKVGSELRPRIDEYGRVTSEAVKRDFVGGPRTAARVVFHLSHLEHKQKETSVRFDFHSDGQQCTNISFVVCKENEATLHRRLLSNVADTFLVTIPDDSPTAAYFAAAQIVYWRLFTQDREHGYGSYLVVQNNIDGVSEMSGRSLASKRSTIQRAATFLQQTLLQERQRSQHALLKDLSSREALLQLGDLLLDDLLDCDAPPAEQLTRDMQREITREFETTFSPDRKLQDFPGSDFQVLLEKCKGRRAREWLLTCAQKLHPTLGVSIHMPRDQLHVYIRDVYPDNTFQAKTSVPSFFLLVDAHATRVLSPLHVAGFREDGQFNKRLLNFARFCWKRLEAQGRRSLASPIFSWRHKTFLMTRAADGLDDEQCIQDLDVTKIEKVWRQPPVPKTFAKPEGTNTLDAKLPGPRQLRLLDMQVDGNGLAAAVSSVLTSAGAVPAATLRQQVAAYVKQNFRTLNLPDVASTQAAKKWAEAHAKEGSGLELDFVHALAHAKSINVTVALVNEREQLRFYMASSASAKASDWSYVFGYADGIYSPVGFRKEQITEGEQEEA